MNIRWRPVLTVDLCFREKDSSVALRERNNLWSFRKQFHTLEILASFSQKSGWHSCGAHKDKSQLHLKEVRCKIPKFRICVKSGTTSWTGNSSRLKAWHSGSKARQSYSRFPPPNKIMQEDYPPVSFQTLESCYNSEEISSCSWFTFQLNERSFLTLVCIAAAACLEWRWWWSRDVNF